MSFSNTGASFLSSSSSSNQFYGENDEDNNNISLNSSSSSTSSSSALSLVALELQAALEEISVPNRIYDNKNIRDYLYAIRALLLSIPARDVSIYTMILLSITIIYVKFFSIESSESRTRISISL